MGPSRKRRKPDELECLMLKALQSETEPNRHLSFFQGILPALEKFEEPEVLKFQMGVLQLISNINDEKRRASQLLNYPQPQSHASQLHQIPRTSYQYYQNADQSAGQTSFVPLEQPINSPSPAYSGATESYNSIDF